MTTVRLFLAPALLFVLACALGKEDDEGAACTDDLWYRDADGDGRGDSDHVERGCDAPAGYVAFGEDCDDDDAGKSPGAFEICNGRDDDCDGNADAADDDAFLYRWFGDVDGDGFGDPDARQDACDAPSGFVDNHGDCDDGDAGVNPDASELCDADAADEDCDGLANDDDPSATGSFTVYPDSDGDGYGNDARGDAGCTIPPDFITVGGDCDDGDAAVNPDASDRCGDGVDQDCTGADAGCGWTGNQDPEDGYLVRIDPLEARDWLGVALAAGDFDGDGTADLAVGAPLADHGSSADAGAVYVYAGPLTPGEQAADEHDAAEYYGADSTRTYDVGYGAVGLGDLDRDGADELGLWQSDGTSIFRGGGTGAVPSTDSALDTPCASVAPAGDGAFLCGVPNAGSAAGAAYVYEGLRSSSPTTTFTPESRAYYMGDNVAAGDFDGDGVTDAWISAPFHWANGTNSGRAYLMEGPFAASMSVLDADATITGDAGYTYLGYGLLPGDVDGDGRDDIIVGANGYDSTVPGEEYTGAVMVYTSATSSDRGLSDADVMFVGEQAGDNLGIQGKIATGDVNGDGAMDLLLGTFSESGESVVGSVTLAYGPFAGRIDLPSDDYAVWRTGITADHVGNGVAILPDMDGDGLDEVAFGAYASDEAFADGGAVWVWSADR